MNSRVFQTIVFCLLLGAPMFGFGKDRTLVRVEFIEKNQKAPFAVSEVPIDQLPDTFAIDTTLHIKQEEWRVVRAEPSTKAEFKKSGRLSVFLSKPKTVMVNPKELLYSLPTISNDIAALIPAKSLEGIVVLHEDDWRQSEFVSQDYEKEISDEIRQIKAIYENERAGVGFKNVHVRKQIVLPLRGKTLTLKVLKETFGVEREYTGVAFSSTAAVIKNGFAFTAPSGWLFWGQLTDGGTISYLCLRPDRPATNDFSAITDAFLLKHGLYFVDWSRMVVVGQNRNRFADYLK